MSNNNTAPQSNPHSVSAPTNKELADKLKEMGATKMNAEARAVLDSAIAKLVVFKPIYGTVFLFLNKIQTTNMPTMAVGVIRRVDLALYYNPDFVLKLTHQQLRAVLIHEALHILLHHLSRICHYGYNPKLFNIAADMAINCHIPELPGNCYYPKTFGLEDFQASEWYYEKIKQEQEKGNLNIDAGEHPDDHSLWEDMEDDIIKEKIKGIADKAIKAQDQKGWSDIGSDLAKSIIEANKPVINWKREVRWFIHRLVLSGAVSTRTRINRREQSSRKQREGKLKNVYTQPGSKRDFTSKILIGIDTSGSVSDEELREFISEVNGMVDHIECHVMCFDTKLIGTPEHISKKVKSFDFKGRGGTDFHPIIEYVDQHKYDGLIVMTDGFAPFPPQPKARVLWCLSKQGESVQPPYGKRVVVDIKTK